MVEKCIIIWYTTLVNMDFNKGLINGACGVIQGFNQDTISISARSKGNIDISQIMKI